MKQLNPTQASQHAADWLDTEMKQHMEIESSPARRQLIKTLYTRQKKAAACLGLVKTEAAAIKEKPSVADQEPWMQILLHPAGSLLLPVLILVLAIFRLNILTAVVSVLMLVRAVLLMLVKTRNEPEEPAMTGPFVDDGELDALLRELRSSIAIDVDSIMGQFSTSAVRENQSIMNDVITVYTSLYEAKVDTPENNDLAYPLSVLTTCLHRSGLDVVHYAPENAALFEVLDVDYRSMERTPAIIARENGVIMKKGLYLNGNK